MLHAVCDSNRDVPLSLLDLILVPGVNIDAQDPDGNTAVNIAAGSDRMFPVVKYLVEKGARLDIPNENEVAPRGTALQVGAKKNAEYLKLKKGATYVSRFPEGNKSAACVAVLSGEPSAVDAVPRADLEAMTARTSFGVPATPLHLAVERGDTRIIEALSRRTPDWNVGDRYGRSPLMHAVILGRADIVAQLLSAGADPTKEDDWGASAFSRAAGMRPAIARLINERGFTPKTEAPGACGIWAGDLDLVKSLSPKTPWEQDAVTLSVTLGETRITELLAPIVPHKEKKPQELIDAARESQKAYAAYAVSAAVPLEAPTRTGGIALKRGSFPYVVESWSPWLAMKVDKKLKDYPMAVYVPKDYDGSAAYGLIISMIHAQSANQSPRPEFAKILDKRKLIWVGFDPYNGIYEPFEDTHECLALAAVYNMLGYFRIDRSRIYMAGFSWGGRLTGEIVPKQPRIFTGGIAVGGCFTTGQRITPAFRYAREHVRMVMVTGDWDYNRVETYNGYSLLTTIGFRNCLFIQEPLKGHSVLSAESFEKSLRFLDER
jgi:ankyrin repeat protein